MKSTISLEKNQGGDTMKKKRMVTALLTTAMVFGAVPTAFAADNITVTVDGQKVSFGDQQPVNINGRVMVPVRAVAEKMGWDVEWFTYYGNTVVDGQFQQEHDIVLKISLKNLILIGQAIKPISILSIKPEAAVLMEKLPIKPKKLL